MNSSIRRATPADQSGVLSLLIQGAEQRSLLDPVLWRLAPDIRIRIERAVASALAGADSAANELWHVAEYPGHVVGVFHAMLVSVPPIYDAAAGAPGLILDDCHISADAPAGTAEALLASAEAALTAAGA